MSRTRNRFFVGEVLPWLGATLQCLSDAPLSLSTTPLNVLTYTCRPATSIFTYLRIRIRVRNFGTSFRCEDRVYGASFSSLTDSNVTFDSCCGFILIEVRVDAIISRLERMVSSKVGEIVPRVLETFFFSQMDNAHFAIVIFVWKRM